MEGQLLGQHFWDDMVELWVVQMFDCFWTIWVLLNLSACIHSVGLVWEDVRVVRSRFLRWVVLVHERVRVRLSCRRRGDPILETCKSVGHWPLDSWRLDDLKLLHYRLAPCQQPTKPPPPSSPITTSFTTSINYNLKFSFFRVFILFWLLSFLVLILSLFLLSLSTINDSSSFAFGSFFSNW